MTNIMSQSRREFLTDALTGSAAAVAALAGTKHVFGSEKPGAKMRFGMVTYLWGRDWDLPTLIANCEKAGILGVELRTTHAHGVEPTLNAAQRHEVRKRFADSRVTYVGIGSDERFDNPDPAVVREAIEATKAFVKLSHDTGGSGVKVKPNSFHEGVPHETTITQIGRSLNVVGKFAADYGQQIRLEVHGPCAELPTIKRILDVADHPNVAVCWNSNPQDLQGRGLEYNFNLVKDRLGVTCHVHNLTDPDYPYQKLFGLLVGFDYAGWLLLEASKPPQDRIAALIEQRKLFARLKSAAQESG